MLQVERFGIGGDVLHKVEFIVAVLLAEAQRLFVAVAADIGDKRQMRGLRIA